MSILDRLSRLLRANVNDLISRAEDPGMIIEQALRDMRGAYSEARTEVAGAMAQNAKLEREANLKWKKGDRFPSPVIAIAEEDEEGYDSDGSLFAE